MRVVDLFCGAGGSSTGAVMGGATVVAAVNHWDVAVATHRANHPTTLHVCQDAGLLDPRDLPEFDTLIASPSCQGHADARGIEQPRHAVSRATAWCVVNVCDVRRPRRFVVENIPEMKDWALYEFWLGALRALGYAMAEYVVNARDFGVPQDRERLIVVGAMGRTAPRIAFPQLPQVPASSFIRFDDTYQWSLVDDHVANTVARVERGRKQFGPRFVMPYYKSGSGLTGRSLDRPIGTITTRARWAVVNEFWMRMVSVDEAKVAMGMPRDYVLTGTQKDRHMQLGNAVVPEMMATVVRQLCAQKAAA